MSDIDKLLTRLDQVDSKLNDFEKSKKAAEEAAVKGVAELQSEIKEMRTQNQQIAELAKKGIAPEKKNIARQMGELIRDCIKGVAQKDASEGTDGSGGYLVNDELTTEIKSVQNQYGIVRQLFGSNIYPMASDVCKVPVDTYEDTDSNAPVPAATSENAAITQSDDAQIDQVTLTASKQATLNYVSNELISDSFMDYLGAFLLPKLARKAAKREDTIVFTTAITGLLNTGKVQQLVMPAGSDEFGSITVDDLYNMQDEVVDDALEDGKYIMHRSILNYLRKLKDDMKNYILTPAAGEEPANLCGYPYLKGSIMPAKSATAISKGFVIFGDVAKGCVFGERNTRQIVTDKSFRFNYDQTAIRMTWRPAFNTNANIGKAICVLKTAAALFLAFVFGTMPLCAQTKYAAGSADSTVVTFGAHPGPSLVSQLYLSCQTSNGPVITIQQRKASPVWVTSFASGTGTNLQANNAGSGIAAADVCIVQHASGTCDYRTVAAASTTNVAFTAALSEVVTNNAVIYEMQTGSVIAGGATNVNGWVTLDLKDIFTSLPDSPVRINVAPGGATNYLSATVK